MQEGVGSYRYLVRAARSACKYWPCRQHHLEGLVCRNTFKMSVYLLEHAYVYAQAHQEDWERTWGSRGVRARRAYRGSHSGRQTWRRQAVECKVLVLLHGLLKLQQDGRHGCLCVVHLHELLTLLRASFIMLPTILPAQDKSRN